MSEDERAIRDLVQRWLDATAAGDLDAVLDLMTDDILFIVPGQEPFGKAAFAQASRGMAGIRFEGKSDIQELRVLGDWAWLRNRLDVTMTPPGGTTVRHAGQALTLLRKEADGIWRVTRDANLVAVVG